MREKSMESVISGGFIPEILTEGPSTSDAPGSAELLGSGSADEITGLYAPDASVEDPVGSPVRRGHAEIRELYDRIEKQTRTVELLSV